MNLCKDISVVVENTPNTHKQVPIKSEEKLVRPGNKQNLEIETKDDEDLELQRFEEQKISLKQKIKEEINSFTNNSKIKEESNIHKIRRESANKFKD